MRWDGFGMGVSLRGFGYTRGSRVVLGLRVVAMGDRNGVAIAQATHEGLLEAAGCMVQGEVLRFGREVPGTSPVSIPVCF